MVTFLNSKCIAVYWLITMVSSDQETSINKVYADVDKDVELTFTVPLRFAETILILHTRNLGEKLLRDSNKLGFLSWDRDHINFQPYENWKPRIHESVSEYGVAKLTIKSIQMEDAGFFLCSATISNEILFGCSNLLIIAAKPKTPTITLLGNTFKCEHKTHNRGLGHVVNWQIRKIQEQIDTPHETLIAKDDTLYINDAKMLEEGLNLTCSTADVYENKTAILFSDSSELFVVKPGELKVEITSSFTTKDKTIRNRVTPTAGVRRSTKTQGLEEKKIEEESTSIAWAALVIVLFVLIAFSYLVFHMLMKNKKPGLVNGQPNNESAVEKSIRTSSISNMDRMPENEPLQGHMIHVNSPENKVLLPSDQ